MLKEKKFWQWFEINNLEYTELEGLDKDYVQKLLNDFLSHIQDYSQGLYFQIGGDKICNELIITADGNTKYFIDVQNLVNAAPKINNWEILAFKPPMGIDFVTEYEGVVLEPKKMWFLPLENENRHKKLGLKIGINNFNKKDENKYLSGAYQVIDTILGEKSCALDIKYLEVTDIPTNPEEEGFIELAELLEYIKWFKSR